MRRPSAGRSLEKRCIFPCFLYSLGCVLNMWDYPLNVSLCVFTPPHALFHLGCLSYCKNASCFVGFRLNLHWQWRRCWVKRSSLWQTIKYPQWSYVFIPSRDWHLIFNQALATAIPWLPRQLACRLSQLLSRYS